METLKVSVIIPLYNAGEFLKECLDSVIRQTLKDLEIIVINDGSKDNSDDIMKSYVKKDKRIRYINRENRGVSATRNEGIKNAIGEYIAFLDADDWVDKDFYEKLYLKAKEAKADLVIAPHVVEVFEKSTIKNLNINYTKDIYLIDLLKGNVEGFVWNKLYKKNFLENSKIEFPNKDELNYGEDQYFTTRVLVYANVVSFIDGTYLHYRYNKSSLVHTYQKNLTEDMEILYQKNKE
ncbi:MAG: glycosyltransferase family 2 protein, partial [Sarcina sp.]